VTALVLRRGGADPALTAGLCVAAALAFLVAPDIAASTIYARRRHRLLSAEREQRLKEVIGAAKQKAPAARLELAFEQIRKISSRSAAAYRPPRPANTERLAREKRVQTIVTMSNRAAF
jgi:hypothetical protein